jgi:hypothetical protein
MPTKASFDITQCTRVALIGASLGCASSFAFAALPAECGGGRVCVGVTSTSDGPDTAGTLREAIEITNAVAGGGSVIYFDIPDCVRGPVVIAPTSQLPALTQSVLIDGFSCTGAVPNSSAVGWNGDIRVVLDGSEAGVGAIGLQAQAGDVYLRGLSVVGWDPIGIRVGSPTANGGLIITGSFIGLLPDGISRGNGLGIDLRNSSFGSFIGGDLPEERVVISGNALEGIRALGRGTQLWVNGSYIGVAPDGVGARGNGGANIALLSDDGAFRIGGENPAQGNVIGFAMATATNDGAGIRVLHDPLLGRSQVSLLGNRVVGNAGLGIDVFAPAELNADATDGVTANDAETDEVQNFPELSSATLTSGGLRVDGSLRVAAVHGLAYRIELFASADCDASGHGEGERLLASFEQVIDPAVDPGLTTFSQLIEDAVIADGEAVTATATNVITAQRGSSEFSRCVAVVAEGIGIFADGFETP